MAANTVSHISGKTDRQLPEEDIKELREYAPSALADPSVVQQTPFKPDILVGADQYWTLITDEPHILLPSGIRLIKSRLGLVVSGSAKKLTMDEASTDYDATTVQVASTEEPAVAFDAGKAPDMEAMWNLETIGITESPTEKEDDEAITQFNESVTLQDGRYCVKFPFVEEHPDLPDNYALALGRFIALTKSFKKDMKLLQQYDDVIQQQLKDGMIEEVDCSRTSPYLTHYIPHHPVIKLQKATTKVRIVYDASSKAKKNLKSLNDCLLRGPNLLPDLVGLLMRFREAPIAMVADVEKAFLQISIQECHRDVTRFFWYKNPKRPELDGNLAVYRFARVPFGAKPSPFLLNATVKYHLQKKDTPVARELQSNMYVDNAFIGARNKDEAMKKYKESKEIFTEASMNLREWISNSAEINRLIPEMDRAKEEQQKFLGLTWHTRPDILNIAYQHDKFEKLASPTKRTILQQVASVYDPLGLVSPAVLQGKQLLQTLWKNKIDWDEEIADELKRKWFNISDSFSKLRQINVTRYIGTSQDSRAQLHAFVDASKSAYAVVVYIRIMQKKEEKQVHLVYAKTRLAPVKTMSIPRLELMAMTIGARALAFVRQQIGTKIDSCTLWSDSQCCLQWTKTSKVLSVFVNNRIKEIKKHELTMAYVPTKDNPADIASRGCSVDELASMDTWWHGPKWLDKDDQWPKQPAFDSDKLTGEAQDESRKEMWHTSTVHLTNDDWKEAVIEPTRFSSLTRLLRVTVYVGRFIKKICTKDRKKAIMERIPEFKCLQTTKGQRINGQEMTAAETFWIKEIQKKHYAEVLQAFEERKKHTLIQSLGLKKDAQGILRCYGRFKNAELPVNAKFPVLLAPEEYVTGLIMQEIHKKLQHAGVAQTLANVRLKYWIPKGRTQVMKILRKCVTCKKYGGGPYRMAPVPPLPDERVQKARPFEYTGIDLFGHLWMKTDNGEKTKCWIVLFVCFVTRAIHLELITGMTSQQILNALRRFIARRTAPSKIISDNAPQFKLIDKTQQDAYAIALFDDNVFNYVANEKIEWQFITEYAPWEGGLYERLVGVTKQAMKKAIGRRVLTFDQLLTYMAEAEAVVNSRPLTYMTEQDGMRTIRPIDFQLYHGYIGAPMLADSDEDDKDPTYQPKLESHQKLVEFWRNSQRTLDIFWKLWQEDYLLSLRERNVKHQEGRIRVDKQPTPGEIVLVYEDDMPRSQWRLGKIEKVLPGVDGLTRSVELKLPNGAITRRSIKHLYPLEIIEKPEEKKIQGNAKRHKLPRPISSIYAYNVMAILLAIQLFMNCQVEATYKNAAPFCPQELEGYTHIEVENCTAFGLVAFRGEKQDLCWNRVLCPTGHVQEDGSCGPLCGCPKWATDCFHSDDENIETEGDRDAILQGARPNICSMTADVRCSTTPTYASVASIQLYDGTVHHVQELKLEMRQPRQDLYKCVGKGPRTGTTSFCEKHECEENGTQFCYSKTRGVTYFVTPNGKIPVQAWGAQNIKYYAAKGISIDTPTCRTCTLSCIQGGVKMQLDAGISQVEICTTPYCYRISNPKPTEEMLLPPDVTLYKHEVTMAIWAHGALIKQTGIDCPSNPFCEHIKCYLCRQRIYNPHCSPRETYLVIFLIIYFSAISLYVFKYLAKALVMVLYYCIAGLFRCCYRYAKRKFGNTGEVLPTTNQATRPSLLRRRVDPKKIGIVLTLITIITATQGCSEVTTITAIRPVCTNYPNGTMECIITEDTRMSLVPQGQQSCMLIKDINNEPMGTLSLQVKKIKIMCTPKNEYFTRSFKMKTEAVRRCSGVGSCYDGMESSCAATKHNTKLPEFTDIANNSTGHTYCQEACGCLECGCFYCTYGCMFYRNYAVPVSDTIHEVFTCPTWIFGVEIIPKLTLRNKTSHHNLILSPGISQTWNNIRFTLNGITYSPTPILGKKFLTDGTHTAIVDAANSGQPIVDNIGQLQCKNRQAAEGLDCYLPKESCQCNKQGDNIGCICSEHILEKEYTNKEQMLPLTTQGLSISMEGPRVIAEYSHIASLEVQVSLEGFQLISVVDRNTCTIKPLHFTGCYNCQTGARLDFECTTDFGDTLAHVVCGIGVFSTICTPQGIKSHAIVSFASQKTSEKCIVTCPAGTTTFTLEGTLYFVDKDQVGQISNTVAGRILPSELTDFWQFVNDSILSNWKYAAFGLALLIPLIFILISCGPPVLLFVIALIMRLKARLTVHRTEKQA